MRLITSIMLCVATLAVTGSQAHAHATLETKEAPAGSQYKVVLRTPHGCNGSPTIAVKVRIPNGVTEVKPQPKPGWEVEIVTEDPGEALDDTQDQGASERISEVHWTGGRLIDAHYDEFIMSVRLPDAPGQTLYFATVQECEQGVERWIDLPDEGQSAEDLDYPAPGVVLTPN